MTNMSYTKVLLSVCLTFVCSISHSADDLTAELDALKKKVGELEAQQTQRGKRFDNFLKKQSEKVLEFNGFMSIGLSQVSEDGATYETGQTGDLSILPNTLLGLQLNARLYDGGELVTQVVFEGHDEGQADNFEPQVEWLYLNQDLGAGFNTHVGRIRFPLFQESENYHVGFTYPWITPPTSIYGVLRLNSVDGISLNHSLPMEDWILTSKLLVWADANLPLEFGSATMDNIHGLSLNFGSDYISIRLAYMVGEQNWNADFPSTVAPALFPDGFDLSIGDDLSYTTLAFKYDDGQLYTSAEAVAVKADDSRLAETEAWNVTFGWHFGPVLAYVSYSKTEVVNSDEIATAINATPGADNHTWGLPFPASFDPATGAPLFNPATGSFFDF